MNPDVFLERHRPKMLSILRSASPALQGNPEVRRFLEQVDEDFAAVTDRPSKRDFLAGEDVFWWCHGTLTQLTEIVAPPRRLDPYVARLIQDLRAMAGRLERGDGLPPGYMTGFFEAGDFDDLDLVD